MVTSPASALMAVVALSAFSSTMAASLCIFFTATAAPTANLAAASVLRMVLVVLISPLAISTSDLTVTSPPVAVRLPVLPTLAVALLVKLPTITEAPISKYWFQPVALVLASSFFFSSASLLLSDLFSASLAWSVSEVPLASFTASESPLVADFLLSASLLAPKMPLSLFLSLLSPLRSSDSPSAAELSPGVDEEPAGGAASISITLSPSSWP